MRNPGDPMAPLTPAQIVIELDRYIIGQERGKRAVALAEERLLDLLLPRRKSEQFQSQTLEEVSPEASRQATKDKLRAQLRAGKMDERLIELEIQSQATPIVEIFSGQGMEEMGINLREMLSNMLPTKTKRR